MKMCLLKTEKTTQMLSHLIGKKVLVEVVMAL
jgi:hypothetical protein